MSSESSSQRSSSCQVCGANKKTYHLNYGGAVCLSCRAFFRRKVKQKGQLRLYCKDNDKCQITEENRTSCCRKCRFEKCVKAGMRKESVLNEKQIKVWVWSYIYITALVWYRNWSQTTYSKAKDLTDKDSICNYTLQWTFCFLSTSFKI